MTKFTPRKGNSKSKRAARKASRRKAKKAALRFQQERQGNARWTRKCMSYEEYLSYSMFDEIRRSQVDLFDGFSYPDWAEDLVIFSVLEDGRVLRVFTLKSCRSQMVYRLVYNQLALRYDCATI